MDRTQAFKEFLATQSIEVSLLDFIVNLGFAALLCYILSKIYLTYGSTLSDRKSFAGNFVILGMTTMLIITIVKTSLALSLGLVGALSIVRFRAAIKEPEELAYLFLCIAVGIGLGAGQRSITLVAFVAIAGVIVLSGYFKKNQQHQNLFLTISGNQSDAQGIDAFSHVLKSHFDSINLKRFDEAQSQFEALYQVQCKNYDELQACKNALRKLGDSIQISFLDSRSLT